MAEAHERKGTHQSDAASDDEVTRAELTKLSACEISDGVLALEEPDLNGIKRGGYLEGIEPLFPPSSNSLHHLIARAYPVLIGPKTESSTVPKGTIWSDTCPGANIVVISQPRSQVCAAIGGIHAARLQARHCAGLVISGRVRDVSELQELAALPVWCRGKSIVGAGAEGQVLAVGKPIEVNGVTVQRGDWIVCDYKEQAIVCVPQDKVRDVLDKATKRAAADGKVLEWVKAGGSVQEGFAKFR